MPYLRDTSFLARKALEMEAGKVGKRGFLPDSAGTEMILFSPRDCYRAVLHPKQSPTWMDISLQIRQHSFGSHPSSLC